MLYDLAVKERFTHKHRINDLPVIWYDELVKNKGNANCVDYAINICYEAIMENYGCTLIRCGIDVYRSLGVNGYHHIIPVRWDQKEMIFENYLNDPKANFKNIYKINGKPSFNLIKSNSIKEAEKFIPILYSHEVPGNLKKYNYSKILEIADPETAQSIILKYYNKKVTQKTILNEIFKDAIIKTL